MKQTLAVINAMEAAGVIGRYAISGAIAAYNYVEAAVTDDLDILISFDAASDQAATGLITLAPIFSYLKASGYDEHRKEGIVIEGWPVQFLPVADALDAEALAHAENIEIQISGNNDSVRSRVLRPEHIVATALRTGRPKDLIRVAQFLEEKAVDLKALCGVIVRHELNEVWSRFCRRIGIADPCQVKSTT